MQKKFQAAIRHETFADSAVPVPKGLWFLSDSLQPFRSDLDLITGHLYLVQYLSFDYSSLLHTELKSARDVPTIIHIAPHRAENITTQPW